MILYVKCCPRSDSRTDKLANALLETLDDYYEVLDIVQENLLPLDRDTLVMREAFIEQSNYSYPIFDYAKQFAFADTIVIAAPYWDLSFPAALKSYIENIYVTGLVSKYNENGAPTGLCKANKLYYVTTSGGPYNPDFSYGYIDKLATEYFGIDETELIYVDMLDIDGFDANKILEDKIKEIKERK